MATAREQRALLTRMTTALADASVDPVRLLETVASQTAAAMGSFCGFLRVSRRGDLLEPVASSAAPGQDISEAPRSLVHTPVPLGDDSPIAQAARERRTIHVPELSEEHLAARYPDPTEREVARRLRPRGVIFVPVEGRGTLLGVLVLLRRGAEALPFTPRDVAFAEELAGYAALALTHATLLTMARERTARVAQVSLLSRELAAAAGRPQELLDVIARRIGESLADSCVLRIVREDQASLDDRGAVFHRDPALAARHREVWQELAARLPPPIALRVLAARAPVFVSGAESEALTESAPAALRDVLRRIAPSAILGVPLWGEVRMIAVLIVARGPGAAPFDDEDRALVEDLAAHATIAITNAGLIEQHQRTASRMQTLTEASAAFAAAVDDPRAVLDLVARRLVELAGDVCVVQLVGPGGDRFEPATAVIHPDPSAVAVVRTALGTEPREITAAMARVLSGETMMMSGTVADLASAVDPRYRVVVESLSLRSMLAVPLQIGTRALGVVTLARAGGRYSEAEIQFAGDLIAHAALAVRNSRLLASVRHELGERARAEAALRQSEEQLRQAQKMEAMGRLAGTVAHDFNNLLSVVLSSCEFIIDSLPPSDPVLEEVAQIRLAGERAAALTQQLLSFSRRPPLERVPLDLNERVQALAPLVRRLLGPDRSLELRLAPDLGTVLVQPAHVEQVVMNLAVNARDAMPGGGQLVIETSNVEHRLDDGVVDASPGRFVRLAIRDDGEGMSREVQRRLFEPFFTTKPRGKGTGLGLSTVLGIVERNGGTIHVESELRRGTAFVIELPRIDSPAIEVRAASEAPPRRGVESILVVEDEDAVRRALVGILSRGGYRVVETRDGVEALATYERVGGFDLVLTDVVMPQLGGPELALRLRARRPDQKVLFMSGYVDDAQLERQLRESGVTFLEKPLVPGPVLRKVREVLDAAEPIVLRSA